MSIDPRCGVVTSVSHDESDFRSVEELQPEYLIVWSSSFGEIDRQEVKLRAASALAALGLFFIQNPGVSYDQVLDYGRLSVPERRILLYSTHGQVEADADSGLVVRDGITSPEWESAKRPLRLNIEEFRSLNPGVEAVGEFDILNFGYWMNDGTLCPAVLRDNGEEIHP